jgi:hypothetical protein
MGDRQMTNLRTPPIIFSGDSIPKILAGQKTMTRRLDGLKHINEHPNQYSNPRFISERGVWRLDNTAGQFTETVADKFPVGQHRWVRENAWIAAPNFGDEHNDPFANCTDYEGRKRVVGYSASMDSDSVRCAKDFGVTQSPSIHMPRWASRLSIEIVERKLERLWEISEGDILSEGIHAGELYQGSWRPAFRALWDKKNGKRAPWNQNFWVWAVSFRKESHEEI